MASNLERFERRLALSDYFLNLFGVRDVQDAKSVNSFYALFNDLQQGYDAEGRSYVFNVLKGRVQGIEPDDLLRYDTNIRRYREALNQYRTDPITLKYFQILSAMMTELYLDRTTRNPAKFLQGLNDFVDEQNERRAGRIDYPHFAPSDLGKIAYWMATGSGKTLIMHLNYYQWRHYRPGEAENILLVTPNEGLSVQHINEMSRSGINARRFTASSGDLFTADPNTVKVVEITKLVEEKTGGGESLEVSSFEGRNLLFVDEGHKGAGSDAQTWRNRRQALAEKGFTFEYSATFGQGVAGAGPDVEEEYAKAILFNYSYPRFYEDGFGKDYRILNLKDQVPGALRDRYLLANLLSFYEQVRFYAANEDELFDEYNIAPPLLVFIGHTVTAGKTPSALGKTDRQSLADVQEMVLFLERVLTNEDDWVPRAIESILAGETEINREDGTDLFEHVFRDLRSLSLDSEQIYQDILERVFHVSQPSTLHLANLITAQGEIGLRAATADRYFGLINIGNDTSFLSILENKVPHLSIESDQFSGSLFQDINQRGSSINVLLGARKFIEGWDSWRVSTMGLLNIGRGEGPQIVQLFGRGVRLLGKGRTLKRSSALDGDHPKNLPLLETLNIFGVRARYMAQFRDYLAEEGIDTEDHEELVISTRINNDFKGHDLQIIRPREERPFTDEAHLRLKFVPDMAPTIDLRPIVEEEVSEGATYEHPAPFGADEHKTLPRILLPVLDWRRLRREMWKFRASRGYGNLVVDENVLRNVLEEECYELFCPDGMLEVNHFSDIRKVEDIALMILRKYTEGYYNSARRSWEKEQLTYSPLDDEIGRQDGPLIREIAAEIKRSATDILEEIRDTIATPELYSGEEDRPDRVYFDRSIYLPLLIADSSDDQVVKYFPPGLNRGEKEFVEQLRGHLQSGSGNELLKDWELFLLRNPSRGRGIGFLIGERHDQRFYPDFILWLKRETLQHIVFIEPHGLIHAGHLDADPKIAFHRGILEYQAALNQASGRDDVLLHSYVISRTPIKELRAQSGLAAREDFHKRHVYFPDDDLGLILDKVVE